MIAVEWTPRALAGFREQLDYYESYSRAAGQRLARKVKAAEETLSTFANSGRARGVHRIYPVPSTTMLLIYRVHEHWIEIAACVDGRENWQANGGQ